MICDFDIRMTSALECEGTINLWKFEGDMDIMV